MSESKQALVIGATGFLGKYISDALHRSGWNVIGIARRSTDTYSFPLITIDIATQPIDEILRTTLPDLIVFAAGSSSVASSIQNPLNDFFQNGTALALVLNSIRNCAPQSRIIVLSSAAIYGNPASLPILESAPLAPISPYGYHKWVCEQLVNEYHHIYGLNLCVVRIFSAYGAGLKRQVLWDIGQQILKAHCVELSGNGLESRDFIHASDIGRAIVLIADRPEAFDAQPYNLATGAETTIRQIAEALIENINPTSALTFSGVRRTGDPANWCADISRLESLGFKPTLSLQQGIANYASWLTQVLD